jgi:hypothetical protein
MNKPKNLEINPMDYEYKLLAVSEDDPECFDSIMANFSGTEVNTAMSPQEAKKIGEWFLKFAEWSKKRGK